MTPAAQTPVRILFVEDSELDFELLVAALERNGIELVASRVEDAGAMRAALAEGNWDAVISDRNLPLFSAEGAQAVLRESGLDLPFLVVSGDSGEEVAVEAMLAGADDYIMKGRLGRLAPALRRSIQAAAVRRERAAAEVALRESESRLHLLSQHLESVKETERAAAANEITEEVGSSLTALKFELAWLQRHAKLAQDAEKRLLIAIGLLEQASSTAQGVVGKLYPVILDQGIVPALEWLTAEFGRKFGIATHFDSNREEVLDRATAIGLYRVCQEALDNVGRHAAATAVHVHLFATEEQIHLEIADNGRGMVETGSGNRPFGLAGMRERARGLGGSLDISSDPGKGTTVLLSVPHLASTAGAGDA